MLDWEIPPEWNVRHAAIYTLAGDRVVDFSQHNLHLVQYSEPVDRIVSREELDTHLHSLPNQPDLNSLPHGFYRRTWGFCLSHRDRLALTDDAYRVVIVSTLEPGASRMENASCRAHHQTRCCSHPTAVIPRWPMTISRRYRWQSNWRAGLQVGPDA